MIAVPCVNKSYYILFLQLFTNIILLFDFINLTQVHYFTVIIALKALGRDCTNNNELLHKIGV